MVSTSGEASQPQVVLSVLDALVLDCLPQLMSSYADPKEAVKQAIAASNIQRAMQIIEADLPDLLKDQRVAFKLKKQQFLDTLSSSMTEGELSPAHICDVLDCAKSQLAPVALDAYPEAYTEFKQLLQLVLYANNAACPLGSWPVECQGSLSDEARQSLAESVYHAACDQTGFKPARLCLLLSYLLRLHSEHRDLLMLAPRRAGSNATAETQAVDKLGKNSPPKSTVSQPEGTDADVPAEHKAQETDQNGHKTPVNVTDLCEQLLWPGMDATELQVESQGVASFKETDIQFFYRSRTGHLVTQTASCIGVYVGLNPLCCSHPLLQALMHFVGSSRRDAIAALRAAGNQLWPAAVAEISRLRLNRELLQDLLLEYCSDRGLDVPELATSKDKKHSQHSNTDDSDAMDHDSNEHDEAVTDSHQNGHGEHMQGNGSTAETTGNGKARGRGRGRGHMRRDSGVIVSEYPVTAQLPMSSTQCSQPHGSTLAEKQQQQQQHGMMDSHHTGPDVSGAEQAVERLAGPGGLPRLTVRRSASQSPPAKQARCHSAVRHTGPQESAQQPPTTAQDFTTIAEEQGPLAFHTAVHQAHPDFWQAHPFLLFKVWSAEFSRLIAWGDLTGALGFARAHMTTLANQHPALQPELKDAMALLLPAQFQASASNITDHTQSSNGNGTPASNTAAGNCQGQGGSRAEAGWAVKFRQTVSEVVALVQPPQPPAASSPAQPCSTRLVLVLQELLALHKAWVRAEKTPDPFQAELGITELRLAGNGRQPSNNGAAAGLPGASQGSDSAKGTATQQNGSQPSAASGDAQTGSQNDHQSQGAEPRDPLSDDDEDEDDDGDAGNGGVAPRERDAARIMEILAVPLEQALQMLDDYGDVEAAINSAFN